MCHTAFEVDDLDEAIKAAVLGIEKELVMLPWSARVIKVDGRQLDHWQGTVGAKWHTIRLEGLQIQPGQQLQFHVLKGPENGLILDRARIDWR